MFQPLIEKKVNSLIGDLPQYGTNLESLIHHFLNTNAVEDVQNRGHSPRLMNNRSKVITTGNRKSSSFCCTQHKDNGDAFIQLKESFSKVIKDSNISADKHKGEIPEELEA